MKLKVTSLELKILRHTSEGYKPEDLAHDLNISKKEVEGALKSLHKKLGTKSSLEALQQLARSEFTVVDV
ncbi:MAG: hypothetical protein KF687_11040 [Cyclobacteriaceae bacterium]|nr:hypothetical protein [Cyclobacteriaceae bacterium]